MIQQYCIIERALPCMVSASMHGPPCEAVRCAACQAVSNLQHLEAVYQLVQRSKKNPSDNEIQRLCPMPDKDGRPSGPEAFRHMHNSIRSTLKDETTWQVIYRGHLWFGCYCHDHRCVTLYNLIKAERDGKEVSATCSIIPA